MPQKFGCKILRSHYEISMSLERLGDQNSNTFHFTFYIKHLWDMTIGQHYWEVTMKKILILMILSQLSWAGIELTDPLLRELVSEDVNIAVSVKADFSDGEYIKEVSDRNIHQEIIYYEEFRSGAKLKVESTLTAYGHDWDIDELTHVYKFSCITSLERTSSEWESISTTCQEIQD